MINFVHITPQYVTPTNQLYERFKRYLEDDYNEDTLAGIINRCYPFFHIILSDTAFAGFVYLDNITGNSKELYSAELVTCLHPIYWGDFTKRCAEIYIKKCFEKFGFKKIKALVYPDNFRVKKLLECAGFKKEAELKAETMRFGKPQDIEVYSIMRCKNENIN